MVCLQVCAGSWDARSGRTSHAGAACRFMMRRGGKAAKWLVHSNDMQCYRSRKERKEKT